MKPLLTPEDFHAPKAIPEVGDRRKEKIHLAVGCAIHQWEVVEHHLGELFGTLLGSAVPIGALRVYGSTTGFNMRQQMLSTAADVLFHYHPNDTLQTEFKRVINTLCKEASGRRNEFAHGLVIGQERRDRMHYFLVPSFMSSKKRGIDMMPSYTYTSKEIQPYIKKYAVLDLNKKILDWRATWPKKKGR